MLLGVNPTSEGTFGDPKLRLRLRAANERVRLRELRQRLFVFVLLKKGGAFLQMQSRLVDGRRGLAASRERRDNDRNDEKRPECATHQLPFRAIARVNRSGSEGHSSLSW